MNRTSHITQLLDEVCRDSDDAAARERLWRLMYDELHAIAHHYLAGEAAGRTLQTTALMNEAYLRLFGGEQVSYHNRRHFFAAAAEAMRRILIDDARKRKRIKRGGGESPVALCAEPGVFDQDPVELMAIDEALARLEAIDPRKAEVVKLRYFAGLTGDEVAELLDVSPRTIDSEWQFARAWLYRELSKGDTAMS